jgi:hypothetical protein
MKRIQGNRLRSLHAVQLYLNDHAASLGYAIPGEMRTLLDDCLAALKEAAERQDAHTRLAAGAAARQQELRRALIRDHLALISRIATLRVEQEPALASLTTLGRRLPAEQLAAHARGMAQTADRWADLFIRAGCRPTFVADLHAAADALLGTLHERAMHLGEVRAATVALGTGLARARQVVHVIDGFLRSALAHHPDRLAGWTLVKRVPRVPRRANVSDVAQEDAVQAEEVVQVVAAAEVMDVEEVVEAVDVDESIGVMQIVHLVQAADVVTAVEVVAAPSRVSSFVSRLMPALFGSRRLSPIRRLVRAEPPRTGAARRIGPPIDASPHSRLAYKSVPCRLDRGDPRM